MLVDPKSITPAGDTRLILQVIGKGSDPKPKRLRRGAYLITHFSFNHCLKNTVAFPDEAANGDWLEYPEINPQDGLFGGEYAEYGVCDSPDQFFEHEVGKFIEQSELKYVVAFSKISKRSQPSEGGWRWHKWGPYIGKKEPKYEYIYDEGPEIEEVYVYHIYQCLNDEAHISTELSDEAVKGLQ